MSIQPEYQITVGELAEQIKKDYDYLNNRSLIESLLRNAKNHIEKEAIKELKPILQKQLPIILNQKIFPMIDFRNLLQNYQINNCRNS